MSERPRITVAVAKSLRLTPKEVLNCITALNDEHDLEFQAVHNAMNEALDARRFRDE